VRAGKTLTIPAIEPSQPAVKSSKHDYRQGAQRRRDELNSHKPYGLSPTSINEGNFAGESMSWKERADSAIPSEVLGCIARSNWSEAQRQALLMILRGQADQIEHFVPRLWNRPCKARAALRELEKAGHLARDRGRIVVVETSFAQQSTPAER